MAEIEEYDSKNVSIEDVTVKKETDKALLVKIGEEEMWMPKSQIHEDSSVFREGDEGQLIISKWIAEQKELSW